MVATHAKLSASGSHRWLACPGSVSAEQGYPNTSSFFAQEGTAAHDLAEITLRHGGEAADWVGNTPSQHSDIVFTSEMAEYVQQYVDYVRAIGGEQMYEERVDFSNRVPEGFGTSDAICIVGNTLHAIDLKYGKGLRVDAKENTQGLLYAIGAVNEYDMIFDIQRIVITIHQPRLDSVSEWEISREELERWGDWIEERATLAVSEDAPRHPGKSQCRWCKAKAECPTLESYAHSIIVTDFDQLDDLEPPDDLAADRLSRIMSAKPLISAWLDAVEQVSRERIESGHALPGFKLVAGRSVRRWLDPDAADSALFELLGDKAYESKLLSVAKAEKALGKARRDAISEMIVKPEGKPTMVPDSDPRPALGASCDDFEKIE